MYTNGITGNNEQLYQHYNWYELLVTNINTKFSDHQKYASLGIHRKQYTYIYQALDQHCMGACQRKLL